MRAWLLGFHLGAAMSLMAAAVLVPMPFTEFAPGESFRISPLIEISDVPTTPLNGETLLMTIQVLQPSPLGVAVALIQDHDLRLGTELGPGVERDEFFDAEAVRFERSLDLAVAMGARAAGYDVDLEAGAFVTYLLPGAPARGELEPGDVITAVEGSPVETAEQLVSEVEDVPAGDRVRFTVIRDGEEREVDVEVGRYTIQGESQTGLGILVETIASEVSLPFTAETVDTDIGGPSAGLMVAVTTYDLLADEDLLGGRTVAGTGELFASGVVGPVGGVREKLITAERDGASIFLVPEEQGEVAREQAPEGLEVIAVHTLEEAIRALGGDPST